MEMQTEHSLSTLNFNKQPFTAVVRTSIKALTFIVLLASIVLFLEGILQSSDDVVKRVRAINSLTPNSVDIMIIGNSHAYCTFDPSIIGDVTGKSVYNAALPSQKIDTVYYNLVDLLKHQQPDIVIFEAFAFGRSDMKNDGFVSNVDALNPSFNKLIACFEIFSDKFDAFKMSFRLFRSHSNWKRAALVKENLKYMLGRTDGGQRGNEGFYALKTKMSETTIKKYENSTTSKYTPVINDYSIAYFDRIAQLCRSKGIRLIVTMSPFNKIYQQKINYVDIYNKMSVICKGAKVEYIDFNMKYDELGLGYGDFEDSFHNAQHTNIWGAEKVSRYMSNYIQSTKK